MVAESMAQFVERRRRELAAFGNAAEAAAHDAYGQAIRASKNLRMGTPGEVMAYGAALLQGKKPQPVAKPGVAQPRRPQAVSRPADQTHGRIVSSRRDTRGPSAASRGDRNRVAKAIGVEAARQVGAVAGFVRGGVHAVEGLADGALFLERLVDPVDILKSPPGESANEQLLGAARRVVDYAKTGVADPQRIVRDVQAKVRQMRVDLDPSATPAAPTYAGELRRNFDIGQNQGELVFDVGSLAYGGPLAKGARELGAVSKASRAEKYLAQGFSPAGAAYLAEPYPSSGMGHHFIPRRYKLPSMLGGGPLPRAYSDGPFNRLAPESMTRGDFYERHFQVDPRFYGTKLPRRVASKNWSGRGLGLEKYGLPGRLWHGSPAPLKARVGGLTAGGGGVIHDYSNEEE